MGFFKKVKVFFTKLGAKLKLLFKSISNLKPVNSDDGDDDVKPISAETSYPDDNKPFDENNIKNGEVGGYIIYNKTKGAVIDEDFINNLKSLGIDIVYFNTPRDKKNIETFLSYDEFFEIFEKFKGSGIKLMIYIYETLEKTDSEGNVIHKAWNAQQIKSISNHPAFYAWVAEDECGYSQFNQSKAWITRYHKRIWSDGSRMYPNMSICFFPFSPRLLGQGAIGDDYDAYLELYSKSADVFLADMYPTTAYKGDKQYYNVSEEGVTVYAKTDGGENWYNYLKSQLRFTLNHPESTHRLYMHTCKHVAKEANTNKLYVERYAPTEETIRVQSYANLMAGSNGLMLFVLCDIPKDEEYLGFTSSAFSVDLKPNDKTYNLMKSFYTSDKFKNFKSIITNLQLESIDCLHGGEVTDENVKDFVNFISDDGEVLVSRGHNNEFDYCTVLNTSLTLPVNIMVNDNTYIMNIANNTITKQDVNGLYEIKPTEILMIKKSR